MPPARFVTDSSLDELARRLRFLGYDVVTLAGARLEELFEAGRRDSRTVLTLSGRLPMRYSDVQVIMLPREEPEAALRQLAEAHEAAGPPFSRCPRCNTVLQRRHAIEARGEVPGRVLRSIEWLHHCPDCGKWYWEGSHVARLREWLGRVTGRPLDTPTDR
jgi:uncharacterized protein with PIN domain